MDRESLRELWEADAGRGLQNKDRPAFVREYRDDLAEHVDTSDDLPPEDAGVAEYRYWLERYKGTVTQQLSAETTTDPDTEGES